MRSGFFKSLKIIMVLLCVGLLSILTFSCDGGGGDDGADNTPQTYTASGTYTYDSDTGVLAFTITNSNFTGCGPDVGDDTEDVESISETTMYWPENNMLWERDSGTAGDITGTWDWVDEDGNAYEINIDSDGTLVVIGEIVDCGDNDGSGSGGGGGGSSSTTITGESGNQVDVNGTWKSNCDNDIDDGDSDTVVVTI